MKDRAYIALALIAGALWLILKGKAVAGESAPAAGGGPITVNSTGPTINENLEVDAVLRVLTDKYNVPYKVHLTTADYQLFYQNTKPFDPYDSPVLNPGNVTRP